MIDLSRIHPVSDFVRNYKVFLTRLRKSGRPEVLNVNGKPECVIFDAKTYQEMSEQLEEARFTKAVNLGIEDMKRNAGKSVSGAFSEIRSGRDL